MESYLLSWYFAGNHTSIDSFEKRGQKGILVSIGDERCLKSIPGSKLKSLMGSGQYDSTVSREELLDKAKQTWNVYHITTNDSANHTQGGIGIGSDWDQLLKDNHIIQNDKSKIAETISKLVLKHFKSNQQSERILQDDQSSKITLDDSSDML